MTTKPLLIKKAVALTVLLSLAFSLFNFTVFSDGEVAATLKVSDKVVHSGAEFTLSVELSSPAVSDAVAEIKVGKKTLSVTVPAGETVGSVKTRAGSYGKAAVEKYSIKNSGAFSPDSKVTAEIKVLPKPKISFNAEFLMGVAGKKLTVYYKCKNASEMTAPLPMTLRLNDGTVLKKFTVDASNGFFQHTFTIDKDWEFPYAIKVYNELTGSSCASIPVMVTDTGKRGIRRVDTTEKKIALGFDCGYGNKYTDYIMDTLDEYGWKATFFVTGFFCDKYPDQLKKIHERGYEIGNHTMNHLKTSELPLEEMYKEIQGVNQKVLDNTGVSPVIMRPPYGNTSPSVEAISRMAGCETVLWTMDSYDWDPDRTAEFIINRATDGMGEGCILLFHNSAPKTKQTLRTILDDYREKGLEVVTISELLYDGHYLIDEKGTQKPNPDYQNITGDELLGNGKYTVTVRGEETETEICLKPVFAEATVSKKTKVIDKIKADPSLMTVKYDFSDTIDAPVNKGDVIGKATFIYKNQTWFTADMTADSDVEISGRIKKEEKHVTPSDLTENRNKDNIGLILAISAGSVVIVLIALGIASVKRRIRKRR